MHIISNQVYFLFHNNFEYFFPNEFLVVAFFIFILNFM